MKSIADLIGREARWIQPRALKMEYELRDDDIVHATLRFRSSFKSIADAESPEGRWTFDRTGVWKPRVGVMGPAGSPALAELRYDFWRLVGHLQLADGRTFTARSNFWLTRYEIKAPDGSPVVRLRRISGLLRASATLDVPAPATVVREHPWLVAFAWYLCVLAQRDSSAAAAS